MLHRLHLNSMKKYFKKILIPGTGVLFQAAAQFQPLADLGAQSGSKLSGIYTGGDLSTYISKMFVFAISIGAIIAVVRLMWAGYLYMGSEMWSSKEKAKTVFREVIFGLLLLLSIYLILQKINPQLLNIQILDSVKNSASTGQQAPAGSQQVTATCTNCSYCSSSGVCIVPIN